MAYIVDLQGFKRPINEFVLKEFAVVEVGNDDATQPINLLFEPICEWNALPAKYKRANSWLERNYHGLLWDSGDVPYEAAGPIICAILQHAQTIYVKGSEKINWLSNFLGSSLRIVNLETLDYPALE